MLPFTKYQGAGNDFILIDSRKARYDLDVVRLCDRRLGIGADGVLLLCPSEVADLKMRVFNPDGSEAAMCGNGIRCVYDFLDTPSAMRIEAGGRIFCCRRYAEKISVSLGSPEVIESSPSPPPFCVLDTGVPDLVQFLPSVAELDAYPVEEEGRALRMARGNQCELRRSNGGRNACGAYL